jgi:hypothetical protein
VSGRDLVGATGGLAGLFALSTTVSVVSRALSGFSNRSGKERAIFGENPHYDDCRIATPMTGELGMVHARNVVESAAKVAGVCYGKGSNDVF